MPKEINKKNLKFKIMHFIKSADNLNMDITCTEYFS